MPTFISVPPHNRTAFFHSRERSFGYYETIGKREQQEDALVGKSLKKMAHLTPQEIGYRLWSCYQILNEKISSRFREQGSTASTTVHDGHGNLITATLGDSVAFLAIYNKEGRVIGVKRLNSVIHSPANEVARIRDAGGFVTQDSIIVRRAGGLIQHCLDVPRVNGLLSVSRAIGDLCAVLGYNDRLIPSEAQIDITDVATIVREVGERFIGCIQVQSNHHKW